MKWLSSLLLSCYLASLTGCAFTVYDVAVNYQYPGTVSVNLSNTTLEVGEFTDSRGMQNSRMLFHQKNLEGQTTTGGWQAEKPLGEIVRDGVIQALESANANIQSDTPKRLTGDILELSSSSVMGVFGGELKGKLLLKLQVEDFSKGEILWKDTIVGVANLQSGGITPEALLRECLNNALNNLLTDRYFLQQVTKK